MPPWRGFLCHILIASTQPLYIAIRTLLNPSYLSRENGIWLALAAISWTIILLKVTIPFLTNPLKDLPYPAIDVFPIGHFDSNGGKPVGDNVDRMLKTPNDGLLNLWLPLYLACQIIPTKPETVVEMLNTRSYDWEKPMLEKRLLGGLIGRGLVTVDGQEHKDMRKAVAPAFSGRIIRDLAPLFYSKACKSNQYIAGEMAKADGSALEITALMSRITLDIICAAAVGQDFDAVEGADASLAQIYDEVTHADRGPSWLFVVMLLLMPMSWFKYLKGTPYARLDHSLGRLRAKIRTLLAEKKSSVEKAEKEQEKDIIAVIMRSGSFSDDYLADQLLTFLSAGHDTTAAALAWALYAVCLHPEMQNRLRTECEEKLSQVEPDSIDAAVFDADQMPYLSAVCNETLRLYPPATATSRSCARDTVLGGQKIPAGTQALIPIRSINRDPAFWGPSATEFNPDRWVDGPDASHGGATHPYAFLSFFHGPRSCIGQGFARLEMKAILAALIMRFSFELAEPDRKVELGGFLIAKPDGGLKLKLADLQKTPSKG